MPRSLRVHDRELLDSLEALDPIAFNGKVWRATWATRDPLTGSRAEGRWHSAGTFEALYTSLDADGSRAETYFHLSRAPVTSSSNLRLHRLRVATLRTLDLGKIEILQNLGVDQTIYGSMDWLRCQEIGAAAYFLEFDSLLVPSARWECLNLILFLDRLNLNHALVVEETSDVNWPAWREKHGQPTGPG